MTTSNMLVYLINVQPICDSKEVIKMAEELTVDQIADAMYNMVKDAQGQKKLKPTDLQKAMIEYFGEDRCNKKLCKAAIRELIESGRCVYTYFGGSFIEIPHEEGASKG